MKAVYFLIQNLALGKKVIYVHPNEILSYTTDKTTNQKRAVDLLSEVDTETMRELFMPNEKSFQNDIFDISVEENRYLCLPFNFPDSDRYNKAKKDYIKATNLK
jgi:hypothetical protein